MYRRALVTLLLILACSLGAGANPIWAQSRCDYYASPQGGGTGRAPSSPFQVADFWAVARPGTTLCLLDGVYEALTMPATVMGTAAQPITVRAFREGQATFDGRNARTPLHLHGRHIVLEGVNAHSGHQSVLVMAGEYSITRRLVLWDAFNNTVQFNGRHNTIEDCVLIGRARKHIGPGTRGVMHGTIRRCFARGEGKDPANTSNPTPVVEQGYDVDQLLYENLLTTRDWDPAVGVMTDPNALLYNMMACQHCTYIGSINYLTATDHIGPMPGGSPPASGIHGLTQFWTGGGSNYQAGRVHPTTHAVVREIVSFMDPRHPVFTRSRAFQFSEHTGAQGRQNQIQNVLGVAQWPSLVLGDSWGSPQLREGRSVAEALQGSGHSSIWTLMPSLCWRSVNGVVTRDPLWPWAMEQRMNDALVARGKPRVDLTATMERLFGPIPAQCRGASPAVPATTSSLPAPRNVRILAAP